MFEITWGDVLKMVKEHHDWHGDRARIAKKIEGTPRRVVVLVRVTEETGARRSVLEVVTVDGVNEYCYCEPEMEAQMIREYLDEEAGLSDAIKEYEEAMA